jgi:hypothetical protein
MLKNIESKKLQNFLTTLEKLQEAKSQHAVFHNINSHNKKIFNFIIFTQPYPSLIANREEKKGGNNASNERKFRAGYNFNRT